MVISDQQQLQWVNFTNQKGKWNEPNWWFNNRNNNGGYTQPKSGFYTNSNG